MVFVSYRDFNIYQSFASHDLRKMKIIEIMQLRQAEGPEMRRRERKMS
jgi:hypothetical protein